MKARLDKDQVRSSYQLLSRIYDAWGALTERKARKRCLEIAKIQDGESILEVAVGTGALFAEVLRRNPNGRNEGIDLTEGMLRKARSRAAKTGATNYVLKVGDAYHLDYADDQFDVLLNAFMFDLLPEDDFPAILAEFKRVLRPGGRTVIVTMTHGPRWFDATWNALYRLSPALLGGCRVVEVWRPIEQAGFEGLTRENVPALLAPAVVLTAVKPAYAKRPDVTSNHLSR